METFPLIELAIRQVYYFLIDHRWIDIEKLRPFTKKKDFIHCNKNNLYPLFYKRVCELGIKQGDILIVHASMEALSKLGVSPNKIIDDLFALVGKSGTIAMPAFPLFRDKDFIDKGDSVLIPIYDTNKTLISTGLLASIFCRLKNTYRSPFPNNPLAANGLHAKNMMCNVWKGDLPHGKYSAWGYCAEYHAKVLFLGMYAYNRNTSEHIIEDFLDEQWPIKNWYIKKEYIIRDQEKEFLVTIRERNSFKWSRYLTEHYHCKQLRKKGILQEEMFHGIPLGYINDLKDLFDYRLLQAKQGITSYRVPRQYKKHYPKEK